MDKLDTVLTNSSNLNNDYADLSQNNYQSNNKTTADLIKSINENLSELNFIQNEMNLLSNLNQENLLKKEKLLKMKNDELMEQLRVLESIQSSISTKNRLIEQTNKNMDNQNLNIFALSSLAGFAVILFIVINLKGMGIISEGHMKLIIIAQFIILVITVIYMYNIFYFKDAIRYLFDRRRERLLNTLKKMEDKYNESTYGKEDEWIDENCDCPANSEDDVYADDNNITEIEKPGYFYYDGTAPPQIIVDLPIEESSYTQHIDWLDYSQGGKAMYNPKKNKTTYDNKQYYNYNETNDPSIMLSHVLEETRVLVNDHTSTANI